MKAIFKHGPIQLHRNDDSSWSEVSVRQNSKLVHAAYNSGGVFLYFEENVQDATYVTRTFTVVITAWTYEKGTHVYTIKDNNYTWHVIEKDSQ